MGLGKKYLEYVKEHEPRPRLMYEDWVQEYVEGLETALQQLLNEARYVDHIGAALENAIDEAEIALKGVKPFDIADYKDYE